MIPVKLKLYSDFILCAFKWIDEYFGDLLLDCCEHTFILGFRNPRLVERLVIQTNAYTLACLSWQGGNDFYFFNENFL